MEIAVSLLLSLLLGAVISFVGIGIHLHVQSMRYFREVLSEENLQYLKNFRWSWHRRLYSWYAYIPNCLMVGWIVYYMEVFHNKPRILSKTAICAACVRAWVDKDGFDHGVAEGILRDLKAALDEAVKTLN